jgi:hypothetical protein
LNGREERDLCQEGYSMSAVASMVNMSKAWVGKAVKRFRETGSNKDRAKKGCPRDKLTATLHDPTGLGTTYRAWKDGNLQVFCTLPQPVGPGRIDEGSSFQALQLLFLAPTCRARKD